uniref:Uncharacterized protein n=1 Tax=Populus alba TaxID=43335 RepID=A0A4U5MAY2_POPAL|nr:hypothetical protein D5086_0000314160 [Populus alba]
MYRRPDMITPGVNALGNPIDPRKIQQYFEVGNVYVRFREQERASNALQDLTWRLYAGRLIIAGFSPVTDFCEATCRQYEETVCNRGGYCKKRNWQGVETLIVWGMQHEDPIGM